MSVTFSGLSSGMDTDAIVKELMNIERKPLNRLEGDKQWMSGRLKALSTFDEKLGTFLSKIENLDSAEDIRAKKAELSREDYFSASVDSSAAAGSYQVEVVALARVEKEVTQGYADKTAAEFGTGNLMISVDGQDPVGIAIDDTNNSLEGIRDAINAADAGVAATILNDGTDAPYRLVLTGADTAAGFHMDASNLSGGTYANPVFTETQTAQQAHVRIDNIDVYSETNTISDAIEGVSLDLLEAEAGIATTLEVSPDKSTVKSMIADFVSGYNSVVSFVTSQSKTETSSGGVLGGDAGMNVVKRNLQNLLTTVVDNSGKFQALSELGLQTQRDGTLNLDTAKLEDVLENDLDSVEKLLVGQDGGGGVASQFQNYLEDVTDTTDGFLNGREKSIQDNIRRIEADIERMQERLVKREETLRAQFAAMEQMVSQLNSQSDFLTRQMASMPKIGGSDK
jgi:flagellar hook-associated protein 2